MNETQTDLDELVADASAYAQPSLYAPKTTRNYQIVRGLLAALAAEQERADTLALIIERLKKAGGAPLDVIWERWRSIFLDADTAGTLAAHDAEVKAQALVEGAEELEQFHTEYSAGEVLRARAAAIREEAK